MKKPKKKGVVSQGVKDKITKKRLVEKYVEDFSKPLVIKGFPEFKPLDKDITKYHKLLNDAKLKDLKMIGHVYEYNLKLDVMDRLKSIDKKKYCVVTIFNDNETTDTGVAHCYSRTFNRHSMTYIIISSSGVYDPEFKMTHFYYYANNPYPIKFKKNMPPDAVADAKLLNDTIEMKVIEALAAIDIDKKIGIIMFLVIVMLLISIIHFVFALRTAGVV